MVDPGKKKVKVFHKHWINRKCIYEGLDLFSEVEKGESPDLWAED